MPDHNVFRGGPLDDGLAYPTHTLTHGRVGDKTSCIGEYNWTPEIVVGPTSGLEARVWLWKGQDGEDH